MFGGELCNGLKRESLDCSKLFSHGARRALGCEKLGAPLLKSWEPVDECAVGIEE
ncbi:MAG: hypothetical protein ACPLSM_03500 [Thermosphaera sp.]